MSRFARYRCARTTSLAATLAALLCAASPAPVRADVIGYAGQVVSYDQGTDQFQFGASDNADAALGAQPTDTGSFGGTTFYVTPFNNPWSANDFVSVGLGGQITLKLSQYAMPLADGPEIGVFTFQQLLQSSSGGTLSGPTTVYSSNQALVDVSEDGQNWVALNSGDFIAMDIPANAFQDANATTPSDYHKPFPGTFSDLSDLATFDDVLSAYDGSAGGTWLDISGTGLTKVGYLRFSVPEANAFSFQLEGISLATDAIGNPVPEPTTLLMILAGGGTLLMLRRPYQNQGV